MQIGQIRQQAPVRRLRPNSTCRVQLPDRFKALILLRMHAKYSAIYRNPSEIIQIWLCRSKVENKAIQGINKMLSRQRICVQAFFYRVKILAQKNKKLQEAREQGKKQSKQKLKKRSKQQVLAMCAKCRTQITKDNRNYSGYFEGHNQLLQEVSKQQQFEEDDNLIDLEARVTKLNAKVFCQIMKNIILLQKAEVFSALKDFQQ